MTVDQARAIERDPTTTPRALSGHLADALEDLRAVLARRAAETRP